MTKRNINECPICGKTQFSSRFTCIDQYASKEKFDLMQCDNCGFVFTQDFPSSEDIGKYYDTPTYVSHSNSKKGLINSIYHFVRRIMLRKKRLLIEKELGNKTGSLLDIGAGTGYFVEMMQNNGWKIEAIEKNSKARTFARNHFNLNIKEEQEFYKYSDKSFNVITLWHVMEHLENLNETWSKLYDLLDDKGILVLALPNCNSFDALNYKEKWAAYDVPRHLWHFSPTTIKELGLKHNFTLKAHYPMPFDAFYVSMLTEKQQGKKLAFLRGLVVGTRAWFSSLYKKERSSSMIYIFRKK